MNKCLLRIKGLLVIFTLVIFFVELDIIHRIEGEKTMQSIGFLYS